MSLVDVLSSISFGQRVAEDEAGELANYFVETDLWRRLFRGEVDVIYGPKGSGKSALYTLLITRKDALFDRNILLVPGENPRGATAFKDLVTDPPTSERQFVGLWKLYIASLVADVFDEYGLKGSNASQFREVLEKEGLIKRGKTLSGLLRSVFDYVKGAIRPEALEGSMDIDPISGLPKSFKGKITFREPSQSALEHGYISIDSLFEVANQALSENKFEFWILLDRLDVAFVESQELEHNALRALFRTYLDVLAFEHIRLKIFLRSDIWKRITSGGFREASHITRSMTISWDARTLLNLLVSRSIKNAAIMEYYKLTKDDVLNSTIAQNEFFYKMFPEQVEIGPNKSKTFDWLLNRTMDGTRQNAPRELIHLLNTLREVQIRLLEIGSIPPDNEELFSRTAFKDALYEVSRTRLEQTIYAEYPTIKPLIEVLRRERTNQSVGTLSKIWRVSDEVAAAYADQLVEHGIFELRGTKDFPNYWVPFLYRDALEMIQGTAEE